MKIYIAGVLFCFIYTVCYLIADKLREVDMLMLAVYALAAYGMYGVGKKVYKALMNKVK